MPELANLELLDIIRAGALGLMLLGIAGIVLSRHLVRIVFGLALLEAGVALLLVSTGYQADAAAPILLAGAQATAMVDPLPQALVLTAIVIALGVQALALSLVLRIHRAYGTFDMREVRKHMERDIALETDSPLPASDHAPLIPAKQVSDPI